MRQIVSIGLLALTSLAVSGTSAGAATLEDVMARLDSLQRDNQAMRKEIAILRQEKTRSSTLPNAVVTTQHAAMPPQTSSALAQISQGAAQYQATPIRRAVDWNGFYAGANAGYGWGDAKSVSFSPNDIVSNIFTCGSGTCALPLSTKTKGGLGGFQTGYNWQINSTSLIGVEADFNWAGIEGAGTNPTFRFAFGDTNFQQTQSLDWFGTIRARLGFLPSPGLLLYGTGGFAYGRVTENFVLNDRPGFAASVSNPSYGYACTAGSNCFMGHASRLGTGWTAGGGVEYEIWKNVSLKAEYLLVNLGKGGSTDITALSSGGADIPSSFTASDHTTQFSVARVGFNYRFGGSLGDASY